VAVLGERPNTRALGDDGPQPTVVRCRLQQELTAYRAPEAADAVGVHVGSMAEVGHGGAQVRLAVPAVEVDVAFARPLPAPVEQEHAVAVASEQPCLRDGSAPAGERDDCRAIAARDVPSREP
jgi:hypothetical protein